MHGHPAIRRLYKGCAKSKAPISKQPVIILLRIEAGVNEVGAHAPCENYLFFSRKDFLDFFYIFLKFWLSQLVI